MARSELSLPDLILGDAGPPVSSARRPLLLEPGGTVVAYGWREGPQHWLEVPETATFGFQPGGEQILALPAGAATAEDVRDAYLTLALPVALHVSGLEVLHASAVLGARGVIAFCGFSGTGKTTTAYALSRRGPALWSDDVVVVETLPSRAVMAHQVPFRANLREPTVAALGSPGAGSPAGEGGETAPLQAVVVLERVDDTASEGVSRLAPAQALPVLLPHGFRFDLTDIELRRATVRRWLAVVASVPVLSARFVPSFERLDDFLDDLEVAFARL